MKSYKVTRTMTQEYIAFGNNKEEAYENSYDIDFDANFLNYEDFGAQGNVVKSSHKVELVDDTVVTRSYSSLDQIQELVRAGANILLEDYEGRLSKVEIVDED
tara:strand:+ start:158 stop:466 length:309 start_codon:yes stop_codon:yes gene_type:complete